MDKTTELRFLVDTGADLWLIPRFRVGNAKLHSTFYLLAANGSHININMYGSKLLTLDLGLKHSDGNFM